MHDHSKRSSRASWREHGGYWLMGLAGAAMVLFAVAGEHITSILEYRRSAIFAGEYWRLLTGHLVHGGYRHLALNLAGAAVMIGLFARTYSRAQWALILLSSLVVIDVGFLVRDRDLETYVGFSGVLHGVLAAGAIAWWRTETRALAFALSAITIGKLAWEQFEGPVTLMGEGMRVIVNAHLYGAIGGALGALVCLHARRSGA